MTQDEIIRMAREAGIGALTDYGKEALERFAALVAAHEREVLLKDNPYLAEQLQAYIHIATTVEREACAKVCDELKATYELDGLNGTKSYHEAAAAIRAREE